MSPYPIVGANIDAIIESLASGHCVSAIGLSNMGKTTRMRQMAEETGSPRYLTIAGREGLFVFVDCNRMVELTGQGFYEAILRAALETLNQHDLHNQLQAYYEQVATADNAFQATLNFNKALTMLIDELPGDLIVIFDEFDDVYTKLDKRVLLNLRAFRDRHGSQLLYVSVTTRPLTEIQGPDQETEFSEMFANSVFYIGALAASESVNMAKQLAKREQTALSDDDLAFIQRRSGGHPGLLEAITRTIFRARRDEPDIKIESGPLFDNDPIVRAECVKIWNQLNNHARESLISLATKREARPPSHIERRLRRIGIIRDGEIFSAQFHNFVYRQSSTPGTAPAGVFIDTDSGEVWVEGVKVPLLTDLEHKLLALLVSRRDKLTDKFQIVKQVWGESYLDQVDDARIEKLVSRLRGKIEPDSSSPRYILTVRGRGYRLVSQPNSDTK